LPVVLILEDVLGELGRGHPDQIDQEQDQQADDKPSQSGTRTKKLVFFKDRGKIFYSKLSNQRYE
jgi:hypothetical protein